MADPAAQRDDYGQPRSLRLHLWWTLVLVLAALGGAGLAVAADRPGNPVSRPELTYRADQAAQPWIDHMAADLNAVDARATDLSDQGASALGSLGALDRVGAGNSLASGEGTAVELVTLTSGLRDTENLAHGAIEHWRLGPETVSLFDQLDAAIAAAEDISNDWTGLDATGHAVLTLLQGFDDHDQAVIQAAAAGRAGQFADALSLLNGTAAQQLATVAAQRDQLAAQGGTVDTLNDLMGREQAYDTALIGLYQYLAGGGTQSGTQFDSLKAAVDSAQAALPADNGALIAIVGETAGVPVANELLAMDKSHGIINDALEAVSDAKTGGQVPDQTPQVTQAPTDQPSDQSTDLP